MHQYYINSCDHPLYKSFQDLYRTSFPLFEQRSVTQQTEAFQNEQYKLLVFTENDTFLGFISYWLFGTYCYVEHFAVNTDLRGKGYGSHLLGTFIQSTDKIVLLEIDPITDSISEARLRFYKKCGFYENPYPHKHPAYRHEYQPHPLIVLTTKRKISKDEYLKFNLDLNITVMNKAIKVKTAIIFGGKSAEHEVSLKSASNVSNSMDRTKFIPLLLAVDKSGKWFYNDKYVSDKVNLADNDYFIGAIPVYLSATGNSVNVVDQKENKVLANFNIAFPIIHGTFGEDGTLQGILKSLNIPFVGPDILGSSIAMDKDVTKRLLKAANIPVANSYTLYKHIPNEYSFQEIVSNLGLPVFVKPANAGSSVGVSKVTDETEYHTALEAAFRFDNKILVEEAVIGKELECGVLGNEEPQASVVGEIVATETFYSYEAKYIHSDGAALQVPARIEAYISDEIRHLAVKACKAICCEGMARVDFLLSSENKLVLNEINTLPGFTEISMYPKMWEAAGITEKELITKLIIYAIQRHDRNADLSTEIGK